MTLDEITTENKIRNVSAMLFAQFGYDNVTVRQIAEGVGIKASSIYNHFTNKEEILSSIILYYNNNIEKYYSNPESLIKTAKTTNIRNIITKTNAIYNHNEYELMIYATSIIIRERYNIDYIGKCFNLNFNILPLARKSLLLEGLAEKKIIKSINIKSLCTFWQSSLNELAFKASLDICQYDKEFNVNSIHITNHEKNKLAKESFTDINELIYDYISIGRIE